MARNEGKSLLPGSPAINAGDNTGAPPFGQRGPGFPRVVVGTIDIGAFELQTSNQPPALDPIADRTVPASQLVVTVPLSATDADGDPLTFTATAQSLAYLLQQQYHFFTDGNFFENYGGLGEKWLQGEGGTGWYFLLPSGELHAWDGGAGATGTLVGNVGTSYHADPYRLLNAPADESRAVLSIAGSALTLTRDPAWVSALVITVTVSDGRGGTDSKTFTVTVTDP